MLKQINGILIPGGAAAFLKNKDYLYTGKIIYKLATQMNDNGDYFPIWGTCLGFELLLVITSKDEQDPRRSYPRIRRSLRLEFILGFEQSKMFKGIKQDLFDILATENVAFNNHSYCVTQDAFHKFGLEDEWQETSLSSYTTGFLFISTMEHRKYPFYGVQFHPEKNAYEFTYSTINHSPNAIKASRFFANFFVDECRKNTHCFSKENDEIRHLIYNFPVTFAVKKRNIYAELYLFREYIDYPIDSCDFNQCFSYNLVGGMIVNLCGTLLTDFFNNF